MYFLVFTLKSGSPMRLTLPGAAPPTSASALNVSLKICKWGLFSLGVFTWRVFWPLPLSFPHLGSETNKIELVLDHKQFTFNYLFWWGCCHPGLCCLKIRTGRSRSYHLGTETLTVTKVPKEQLNSTDARLNSSEYGLCHNGGCLTEYLCVTLTINNGVM